MKIINYFSVKKLNTFGLDYKCKTYIELEYFEEIYSVNKKLKLSESKFLVLGEGSNILFTGDFDGIIIHPKFKNYYLTKQDRNNVYFLFEAGIKWNDIVKFAVSKNYWGIENLILIPGLAGAAPIQNIGAYGQEIKDVIESVHFFDFEDNVFKIFNNQQCHFDYRNSIFKQQLKNKILITAIELKFNKTPKPKLDYARIKDELIKAGITKPTITDISNTIANIRQNKLPSIEKFGNAGSFFKNPIIDIKKLNHLKIDYPEVPFFPLNENYVKIPAAWLIEKVGYKGKSTGNVATYENQPLVIINLGNATGEEILNFALEIKQIVFNVFDIVLEPEVNII